MHGHQKPLSRSVPVSLGATAFCDMHVRASRSFPLGSLIQKVTGANHLSSTAFSFCCLLRTYSYELSVRFLLRKSIQILAVITSFGLQIILYLGFLLLYSLPNAFSLVDKCKFNGTNGYMTCWCRWSTSQSHWICRLSYSRWRRTRYPSHLHLKEAHPEGAAMSYSQGSCIGIVLR